LTIYKQFLIIHKGDLNILQKMCEERLYIKPKTEKIMEGHEKFGEFCKL